MPETIDLSLEHLRQFRDEVKGARIESRQTREACQTLLHGIEHLRNISTLMQAEMSSIRSEMSHLRGDLVNMIQIEIGAQFGRLETRFENEIAGLKNELLAAIESGRQ